MPGTVGRVPTPATPVPGASTDTGTAAAVLALFGLDQATVDSLNEGTAAAEPVTITGASTAHDWTAIDVRSGCVAAACWREIRSPSGRRTYAGAPVCSATGGRPLSRASNAAARWVSS